MWSDLSELILVDLISFIKFTGMVTQTGNKLMDLHYHF